MQVHEGDGGKKVIAWEQVGTILQGFSGSNAPETVLSGDFADDNIHWGQRGSYLVGTLRVC